MVKKMKIMFFCFFSPNCSFFSFRIIIIIKRLSPPWAFKSPFKLNLSEKGKNALIDTDLF